MVAKPSIWSVHWRIYACLFALDFTVISLISKLLTPLYMWSLFVVLNPGSLPGLSNAPVRLTAQPAPKKAIVTAIDFCSTLIMWELFARKGESTLCICLFVSPQKNRIPLVFGLLVGVTEVQEDSFHFFLWGWPRENPEYSRGAVCWTGGREGLLFLPPCCLFLSEMRWEYLPFLPHQHVAQCIKRMGVTYSQIQTTEVLKVAAVTEKK